MTVLSIEKYENGAGPNKRTVPMLLSIVTNEAHGDIVKPIIHLNRSSAVTADVTMSE